MFRGLYVLLNTLFLWWIDSNLIYAVEKKTFGKFENAKMIDYLTWVIAKT